MLLISGFSRENCFKSLDSYTYKGYTYLATDRQTNVKNRYIEIHTDVKNWLIWKDPNAGKDWIQEKGMTEDEMVGWHHQLNGHVFQWTPGVCDGKGGLVCCSPWCRKESNTTERLNRLTDRQLERMGAGDLTFEDGHFCRLLVYRLTFQLFLSPYSVFLSQTTWGAFSLSNLPPVSCRIGSSLAAQGPWGLHVLHMELYLSLSPSLSSVSGASKFSKFSGISGETSCFSWTFSSSRFVFFHSVSHFPLSHLLPIFYIHYHELNRQLVGICCITQGAQLGALW